MSTFPGTLLTRNCVYFPEGPNNLLCQRLVSPYEINFHNWSATLPAAHMRSKHHKSTFGSSQQSLVQTTIFCILGSFHTHKLLAAK